MARAQTQTRGGENVSVAVIRDRGGEAFGQGARPNYIGFPTDQKACKISFNFYLNNIEYLKITPMIATVSLLRNHVDFAPNPIDPQRDAVGFGVLAAHGDKCGRGSDYR
jgi:hypothetical protein